MWNDICGVQACEGVQSKEHSRPLTVLGIESGSSFF